MAEKVLVAVSGGVDSSVAMLLLKEQGYDPVAVHMKLWDYGEVGGDNFHDGRCCSLEAINDLQMICGQLSVPFYVLDFCAEFRETVIGNFVEEYHRGRTPNPCILCNTHLKWRALGEKARLIGCDHIATGHYAMTEYMEEYGRYVIRRGRDETRDQSYALWGLNQEALARTLLPLGKLRKEEVRQMARSFHLKNAEKAESREICFVADDDYHRFLKAWPGKGRGEIQAGEIVDSRGRVLGYHAGVEFFTIGQRKGLGISHPVPLYVIAIDAGRSRIMVGEEGELFSNVMTVSDINWVALERPTGPFEAAVKIRYLHSAAPARLIPIDKGSVRVEFETPQRAITPGQSAVFYRNDIVLGGGFINLQKNS